MQQPQNASAITQSQAIAKLNIKMLLTTLSIQIITEMAALLKLWMNNPKADVWGDAIEDQIVSQ